MDDIPLSDVHIAALQACHSRIVKDLDINHIVDFLHQEEAINEDDKDLIVSKQTRAEKCRQLLDTLMSRPVSAFSSFVESLKADYIYLAEVIELQLWYQTLNQTKTNINLANKLARQDIKDNSMTTEESLKDIWTLANNLKSKRNLDNDNDQGDCSATDDVEDASLSSVHIKALRACQAILVDTLDVQHIIDMCYQEKVITKSMKDKVLMRSTKQEQCRKFLDCLETRTMHAFNAFTKSLKEDYGFLAKKIEMQLWEHTLDQTKYNLKLASNIASEKHFDISNTEGETLDEIVTQLQSLLRTCNVNCGEQDISISKDKNLMEQRSETSITQNLAPSQQGDTQDGATTERKSVQARGSLRIPPRVPPSPKLPSTSSTNTNITRTSSGRTFPADNLDEVKVPVKYTTSNQPIQPVQSDELRSFPPPYGRYSDEQQNVTTTESGVQSACGELYGSDEKAKLLDEFELVVRKNLKNIRSVIKMAFLKNSDILLDALKSSKLVLLRRVAMICDSNWKAKKMLVDKDVHCLAAKDDLIAVACGEEHNARVKLFQINGEPTKDIPIRLVQHAIAFSKFNELIINTKCGELGFIDITTGRIIEKISSGSSKWPKSMSVNQDNNIVIGHEKAVTCINREGKQLFKYTEIDFTAMVFNENRTYLDNLGHIFIAALYTIHVLNERGEFIYELELPGSTTTPQSVAVNNQGELVIGTWAMIGSAEVLIYKYKEQ